MTTKTISKILASAAVLVAVCYPFWVVKNIEPVFVVNTTTLYEKDAEPVIEVLSFEEVFGCQETETEAVNEYRIDLTAEEIDLMARVVMSEASILSFDAKRAVAEVIVNRVLSDEYPDTVTEVINQRGQFSTADNGEPNDDCYNAVELALTSGAYPDTMFWFRTDRPHTYGYYYCRYGNTYFSTEFDYETEVNNNNG